MSAGQHCIVRQNIVLIAVSFSTGVQVTQNTFHQQLSGRYIQCLQRIVHCAEVSQSSGAFNLPRCNSLSFVFSQRKYVT